MLEVLLETGTRMLIPISFLRKALLSPEDKLTFNIVQAEVEKSKKVEAEELEKRVLEELEKDAPTEQPRTENAEKRECINIWKRRRPGDTGAH